MQPHSNPQSALAAVSFFGLHGERFLRQHTHPFEVYHRQKVVA